MGGNLWHIHCTNTFFQWPLSVGMKVCGFFNTWIEGPSQQTRSRYSVTGVLACCFYVLIGFGVARVHLLCTAMWRTCISSSGIWSDCLFSTCVCAAVFHPINSWSMPEAANRANPVCAGPRVALRRRAHVPVRDIRTTHARIHGSCHQGTSMLVVRLLVHAFAFWRRPRCLPQTNHFKSAPPRCDTLAKQPHALASAATYPWVGRQAFQDGYLDWSDPDNMSLAKALDPNPGWEWVGWAPNIATRTNVEGVLWGGCLSVRDGRCLQRI